MDKFKKEYRDAIINGYQGGFEQFMQKYHKDAFRNDIGGTAQKIENQQTGIQQNEPIVRPLFPGKNDAGPVTNGNASPKVPEVTTDKEEEKIFGMKPVVFYGLCAVALLIIGFGFWALIQTMRTVSALPANRNEPDGSSLPGPSSSGNEMPLAASR